MARLNLLPWREELREVRRKHFLMTLLAVCLGSLAVVLIANRVVTAAIDRQVARNDYLGRQITSVESRIKQVDDLKERRQQLLERLHIIQDLQGNRQASGRIFDQLSRTLPDGVYFTEVRMADKNLAIDGVARTNNRISDLMRNLEASDWFDTPNLTDVKTSSSGQMNQANVFRLTVHQSQPAQAEAGQ
jgi:type IV pilus assembly protein PilN